MNKIKVSEMFYSIQGEGVHVGAPSVFLRTFGCNFTCKKFGIQDEFDGENPEVLVAVNEPDNYKNFKDLPLVTTGCDSYGSWHPKLKHLSPILSVDSIAKYITSLIPDGDWSKIHLIITGGEPLLGWQTAYPKLLNHPLLHQLKYVTIETNGTQRLSDEFIACLYRDKSTFVYPNNIEEILFSVSPKLSTSGEKWSDAIKPEIVSQYDDYGRVALKFVISNESDVDEVKRAVDEYSEYMNPEDVYVMPVGGVSGVYNLNNKRVCEIAMKNGWKYSPRLQVDLFGNNWGT